jgi:SAM-dependent methyltransferase
MLPSADILARKGRAFLLGLAPRRLTARNPDAFFGVEEIERVHRVYFETGGATGTAWDTLRNAHLRLPQWFRQGLDPHGVEYRLQQQRLWRVVAGMDRDYLAEIDEQACDWSVADPIRTPGFYSRRDDAAISSAADHILATGMLLKHCDLRAGDWALEYGPGFGQSALALSRLGVNVDAVDISADFCGFIREQAAFFQVPLHAFEGRFGDAPRPGKRYKLIWFYESFHHCLDFVHVVRKLGGLLEPDGRLILGGEPIVDQPCAAVPYPWGLRLHSEVVAVVRQQGWFELGFNEKFLRDVLAHAGLGMERIDCEPSPFGRLYVCRPQSR